jgi:hypothetical protein
MIARHKCSALIPKQGGCHDCWCGNHVCYPLMWPRARPRLGAAIQSLLYQTELEGGGWNLILFHPPWLASMHPSPLATYLKKRSLFFFFFFFFPHTLVLFGISWRLEGIIGVVRFFELPILKHFPAYYFMQQMPAWHYHLSSIRLNCLFLNLLGAVAPSLPPSFLRASWIFSSQCLTFLCPLHSVGCLVADSFDSLQFRGCMKCLSDVSFVFSFWSCGTK